MREELHQQRAAEREPAIQELRHRLGLIAALRTALAEEEQAAVDTARRGGVRWLDVGNVLGVSAPTAQQRYTPHGQAAVKRSRAKRLRDRESSGSDVDGHDA